ncbi:hypothetical protein F0562_011146 [Nyssa sinensis]|uniref:Ornithine aminotransferase n=1 Tax=Nyssa sinensis TaxID=561372 RepID=A0A5J5A115_9ASTE|nr:hypothetical protein F0562_011146 [Nyssa sinensis]
MSVTTESMKSIHLFLNNSISPAINLGRSIQLENRSFPSPSNGGRVITCVNVDVRVNSGKLGFRVGNREVMEAEGKVLVGTYARTPVVLSSGKGCKLYDVEGREYLDMTSGIAIINYRREIRGCIDSCKEVLFSPSDAFHQVGPSSQSLHTRKSSTEAKHEVNCDCTSDAFFLDR